MNITAKLFYEAKFFIIFTWPEQFGNKIQFLILSFSNLIKNYLTKSLVKVGGIEIGLSKIQKSYDRIEWNRIESIKI